MTGKWDEMGNKDIRRTVRGIRGLFYLTSESDTQAYPEFLQPRGFEGTSP